MSDPGYAGTPREPDLASLSTDEAMALRWRRGRAARGLGPLDPFQGDPLRELYEELIDGLCYAREAQRQGHDMRVIYSRLLTLIAAVRARILNVEWIDPELEKVVDDLARRAGFVRDDPSPRVGVGEDGVE